MIWRIPWALGVAVLYVARLLSWLLLPAAMDSRLWDCDLCRWAMHDDVYADTPWPMPFRRKCKRCGRENVAPRVV